MMFQIIRLVQCHYISVASRKNQLSDEFFKIGFMPYFLSLNSPLSRYRDRIN